MTLTEQWKKGELESGWYYVKGADGLIGMMSDYALYRVNLEHPYNEITLLAKMPSYEEWKNVTTCFDYEHKAYLSMVEETQQLRKWCEEFNSLDVAKENQQLKEKLEKAEATLLEIDGGWVTDEIRSKISEYFVYAIGEKK